MDDGILLADRTGAGVSLVDMPDSLISTSRSHASRDGELWVLARTEAIPALESRVTLVIRAAAARERRFSIDFRGAAFVDGQFVSPADFADLLAIQIRMRPDATVTIDVDGTLESDVADIKKSLIEAGLAADRLTIHRLR